MIGNTRTPTRLLAVAAMAVVLAAAPAGTAIASSGAPPLEPIDDSHTLDCGQFNANGVTSSNLTVPSVGLTLGDQPAQVGLEESWSDGKSKDFLRISYHEDRDRTLRIWIPASCVSPYANTPVSPVNGTGPTASYSVVKQNGTRYLGVKVVVTRPTEVVYPISESSGWSFGVWSGITGRVGKLTGLGGGGPNWTYVDRTRLQGSNATTAVDLPKNATDPLFQYRAGNDSWAPVPDDADHPAPVYKFRKEGVNNTVFIASEVESAPQVRWVGNRDKVTGNGLFSDLGYTLGQMGEDVDSVLDAIFGSGGGGSENTSNDRNRARARVMT